VLAISRGTISRETLILLGVLIPSVILHEVSHGAVAYLFGDDTAKRAGRLTLNPIAHVDPFGTIILPAIMIISTGAGFGYAKPVPVNPRKMRSPRNHGLVVSLAGPAVNIALALISALCVRLFVSRSDMTLISFGLDASLTSEIIVDLGIINVILAAFNLIPLPPLDGSAVVERVLPARLWPGYLRLRQYSMVVIIAVVFLLPGILGGLFDWALRLWARLLV
jgi:Zn-dependent protease